MLKPFRSLAVFIANAVTGDMLLLVASMIALMLANSSSASSYFDALNWHALPLSPLQFINDGLMAVFFLLVGLEIKREFIDGALSSWPSRILPAVAALGGMIVPCLIFLGLNLAHPEHLNGWAIPAATDIAFALGVLAALGSRIPVSLKVFLTALAILDDLGAILIIAVFYAGSPDLMLLGLALLVLAALWLLNRLNVLSLWPYLIGFVLIWFCLLHSGIHPTLAGVAVAIVVPLRSGGHSPLERLEHYLAPLVGLFIVPVFGFANAGISLGAVSQGALFGPLALGVGLGLFLGKQIGVFSFAYAAIKSGYAPMPECAGWRQLYGVAVLCGIGFTMSLFIGGLAFPAHPDLSEVSKAGVLAGSVVAALCGLALLWTKRVDGRAG